MQKSGWTFTTLVGRYSDYSIKKRTSLGVRLVLFSVEIKGNKTLTYYLLPFQNNKKWSKQRCLIRTGNEQGLGLHNPALSETDRSRGQCVQCQHFVILSLVVCVRQESRFYRDSPKAPWPVLSVLSGTFFYWLSHNWLINFWKFRKHHSGLDGILRFLKHRKSSIAFISAHRSSGKFARERESAFGVFKVFKGADCTSRICPMLRATLGLAFKSSFQLKSLL